ncbi:DUF624 domain-containing protein [Pullulanibacillus sp. KACC 23026]|uniref:DUF624 domain-containing protein n=1 Tax=Pullulanibacillus sp. KACC 23026 TaxID=3028315 RepID=UPI0023B1C40A|nr:DUF624 domain-containing protein [Pullulanibacillus sp. KACC 23026]WEG11092.1 DUF624 domain-containing protein [Pullulanibacillus sp. KACC 23026]
MYTKNPFISLTQIVWNLFLIGICTLITSLLLVCLFLSVPLNALTGVLYLIGFLLIGPTMGAMFQTVFDSLNDLECKVMRTYFHHYRKGFRSSIKLWLPYFIVLLILCCDLYFLNVSHKDTFLLPLLYLVFVLVVVSFVYALILNSKFVMKVKDIHRFSFYLLFNRPVKSILIILLVIAIFLFYKHFVNIAIFWGLPLFSMITFFVLRKLIRQIEATYVK